MVRQLGLEDLELADPDFRATDAMDILLGVDVHALIIAKRLKKGSLHEPIAQNTSFGWIICGTTVKPTARRRTFMLHSQENDLTATVRRFWEQEEIPQSRKPLSQTELECEDHFRRTRTRAPDGRYVVRLPIIGSLPDLSDTR